MKKIPSLLKKVVFRVEGVEIETNLPSLAVYWKSSMMAERLCGKAIGEMGNCGINLVIIGDHENKFTSFSRPFRNRRPHPILYVLQFFAEHIFSCARSSILLTAKYFPHFSACFMNITLFVIVVSEKYILNQAGMMFVMLAKRRVEPF